MALETELATYKAKLEELKAQEGKYVLIHGNDVIDTFSSYDDALKAGYAAVGLKPFLVKQIQGVENAHFIARFADPNRRVS
jgi:hypothetical protein